MDGAGLRSGEGHLKVMVTKGLWLNDSVGTDKGFHPKRDKELELSSCIWQDFMKRYSFKESVA